MRSWLQRGAVVMWIGVNASCLGRPPVSISLVDGQAIIDIQTLGEYPTDVARIRIVETSEKNVVWEIACGNSAQMRKLTLVVGINDASPTTEHGMCKVVVPPDGSSFDLLPEKEYEVAVWGNDHVWSRVVRTLRFGQTGS